MKFIFGAELAKVWNSLTISLDRSNTKVSNVSEGVFDIYKKENVKIASFKFNEKLIEYLRKKNVNTNDFYSVINVLLNEDTAQNKIEITMSNNVDDFLSNDVKVKRNQKIIQVPVVYVSFKAVTAKINYKTKIYKRAQKVEHPELIGTTRVSIEPFDTKVDNAVRIMEQKRPDLLRNVTTIKTNFNKDAYGEYSSSTPNTVYINLKKIEDFVRNNMQNQSQDAIEREIVNQIMLTVSHESGHQMAYTSAKNISEQPAEKIEQELRQMI